MAGPDDRGGEDLFEDLDRYFAPIDEVDWPADEASPAEAAPASGAPGPEVVLPATPEDDVVIDLRQAEPAPQPAAAVSPGMAASVPAAAAPDVRPRAAAAGPSGDDPVVPRGDPTAEMSGEDWQRLREVLGDDDDEVPPAPEPEAQPYEPPPVAAEPPPPAPREGGRDEWGPPGEDVPGVEETPAERPDLTLDDLKKAPPEYDDLPGPTEPAESAPISAEEAADVFMAEPRPADVEQAAERFAESIRVETGEHPPVVADIESEEFIAPVGGSAGELRWEEEDDVEVIPSAGSGLGLGSDGLTDDELGGPAWEESAQDTVGTDRTGGPGSERNLPAATITALVLVAAALISI
ncbi:MAG TPA: hypothetical protein VEG29_03685, partial [Candidatus Binatia bacterium]|nr:hypothetical protein [Candidatus Binatia bacterium]